MKFKKKMKWINFFILPSLFGIILFYIFPFLKILGNAFIRNSDEIFVGFSNILVVIQNKAFMLASGNTVMYMLISIPLLMSISLLFAKLLWKVSGWIKNIKFLYVMPLAIPAASLSLYWQFFFHQSGILNFLIKDDIDWLHSGYGFWVFVFIYIWKNFGYTVILWLGSISKIPVAILEAARTDGASEWVIFVRIILPNLKQTMLIVYILSLINSFKIFREAYALAGDYPHESMYLLQHLFNNWFRDFELDKMAGATILYLIGLLLILFPMQRFSNH